MEIIAYTLTGCTHCNNLKELFRRADVQYKEIKLRVDMNVEEFSNLYPSIVSFPYVVIDGNPIGGLVETVKLFVQKGLVSSSRRE